MLKAGRDRILAGLVIGMLRILARLPASLARRCALLLGRVLGRTMRRRRRVVTANLRLCFPDWSEQQRRDLTARLFQSLGLSVYEIALAWCRPAGADLPGCQLDGLEHINAARRAGRGVLLVNGHFNCLEICSRFLAEAMPLQGVYRPLNNPVMERFQTRARLRYARAMISKRQPRQILAALRSGELIWFAPDQDFGPLRSMFIPFFNLPAATLTATWRLARGSGAVVLTATPRRLPDGNYQITIGPELPGADDATPERMLTALNQRIESAVRAAPEDYWWFHRRFKTTPDESIDHYAEQYRSAAD